MQDAVSRVRSARTAEEVAERWAAVVEPLAQSMAKLSDDLRTQVSAMSLASSAQATAWSQAQTNAAIALAEQSNKTLVSLRQQVSDLKAAAQEAKEATQAARRLPLKHYLLAVAAGTLAAVLTSACWIYLRPSPAAPVVTLDARAVAQYLMTNGGLTCPRTEQRRR